MAVKDFFIPIDIQSNVVQTTRETEVFKMVCGDKNPYRINLAFVDDISDITTVKVAFLKPNGDIEEDVATKTGTKGATYIVKSSVINKPGELRMQVSLIKTNYEYTHFETFQFQIVEEFSDAASPATDDRWPVLETLLTTVETGATKNLVATNLPLMDGVANPGFGPKFAGEGHVHPSDTRKANAQVISGTTPAVIGWYRIAKVIANATHNTSAGMFSINAATGSHKTVCTLVASLGLGSSGESNDLNQLNCSHHGSKGIARARLVLKTSFVAGDEFYLEVYNPSPYAKTINIEMLMSIGWSLVDPSTPGEIPEGYTDKEINLQPGMVSSNGLIGNVKGGLGALSSITENTLPNEILASSTEGKSLSLNFMTSPSFVPGNFASVITYTSYIGAAATGVTQIATPYSDSSGGANMWIRFSNYNTNTWGPWMKMWHSGNFDVASYTQSNLTFARTITTKTVKAQKLGNAVTLAGSLKTLTISEAAPNWIDLFTLPAELVSTFVNRGFAGTSLSVMLPLKVENGIVSVYLADAAAKTAALAEVNFSITIMI